MNSEIKRQVLQLVAQDELEQAIQLLTTVLEEARLDEAIMHAGRLSDLQKQIRLGLIAQEQAILTRSQIRYGILETVKALSHQPQMAVLVAGTGKRNLPEKVYWMAKHLGRVLAEQHKKLIVGGWHGVDYIVAEEFAKVINSQHQKLSEHLVQVVSEDQEPVFRGGNVLYVKKGIKEWLESIKYADMVVLIGGEGGTYGTYLFAKQERKPILPISGTGGDAQDVYENMQTTWDSSLMKHLPLEKFQQLSKPINEESDAQQVVEIIIELINKLK